MIRRKNTPTFTVESTGAGASTGSLLPASHAWHPRRASTRGKNSERPSRLACSRALGRSENHGEGGRARYINSKSCDREGFASILTWLNMGGRGDHPLATTNSNGPGMYVQIVHTFWCILISFSVLHFCIRVRPNSEPWAPFWEYIDMYLGQMHCSWSFKYCNLFL